MKKEPTFLEMMDAIINSSEPKSVLKEYEAEMDRIVAQTEQIMKNEPPIPSTPLDERTEAFFERLAKYANGRAILNEVYEELQATLPEKQKKELPSLAEAMAKVYTKEYNRKPDEKPVMSLDIAPKIEFFNTVAQHYTNAGMHEKAEQTQAKCEEWKRKFSFEPDIQ